jgi:hypothetical protein
MMKRVACLLLGLLSLTANTSFAERTIFVMTPTIRAPQNVLSGSEVVAEYTVTNNTPMTLGNDVIFEVPSSGFTQDTTVTNPCIVPFTLAAGASCILRYLINTAVLPSQFHLDGPEVCHNGTRIRCSLPRPQDRITIAQSDSHTNLANISIPDIVLEQGTANFLQVTNHSNNLFANNIKLTLPPNIQDDVTSVDESACVSLAPQKTCHINITTSPTAVPTEGTISVQGANTNIATSFARLGDSFVTHNNPTISNPNNGGTAVNLTFNNISNVGITVNSISITGTTLVDTTIGAPSAGTNCLTLPSSILPAMTSCSVGLTVGPDGYGTIDFSASLTRGAIDFNYTAGAFTSDAIASVYIQKAILEYFWAGGGQWNPTLPGSLTVPFSGAGVAAVLNVRNASGPTGFNAIDFRFPTAASPTLVAAGIVYFITPTSGWIPCATTTGTDLNRDGLPGVGGGACFVAYTNNNNQGRIVPWSIEATAQNILNQATQLRFLHP